MTLVKEDTNMPACNLVVDTEDERTGYHDEIYDGFAFKPSTMKKTKKNKNRQIKLIITL